MKDQVFAFLTEANIPYRVIEHVAVYRVGNEPPELAELPMTKNLLLKDRATSQVYMVVMEGEKRLDLLVLASLLGTTKNRLQFVKYEDVEATVGVPPGHVSIFNLLNEQARGVEVVLDKALLQRSEIGFHPNVNTATVVIKPDMVVDLLGKLGATYQLVELT